MIVIFPLEILGCFWSFINKLNDPKHQEMVKTKFSPIIFATHISFVFILISVWTFYGYFATGSQWDTTYFTLVWVAQSG
jgi:hypothetical protein